MITGVEVREGFERIGLGILELVEAHHIGKLRRYEEGEVLYWQGAPADCVFVMRRGKVKVYCISLEGKAHTYEILGAGRLIGATALLLGGVHESMAEALGDTHVYVIPSADFEYLLTSDSCFSVAVMMELAQAVRSLASEVRGLSFMDVQQRLKHGLTRLADEHGIVTERGIKIDLDITHEEIAELTAANRSTITVYLNELKRQGYLWKEGRRFVIIPPKHAEILEELKRAVVEYDAEGAVSWAREAVKEGVDPVQAAEALIRGIRQVDDGFVRGTLSLPDVIGAAEALQSALPITQEDLKRKGKELKTLGTVVIGTVYGDIHSIGKAVVSVLLSAGGFRVIDLGVNVGAGQFIEAIKEYRPEILAMSALMTTTAPEQAKIIAALEDRDLRDKVKIMVGGGAITEEIAQRIGADGYEATAREVVGLARELMAEKRERRWNYAESVCP